MSDVSLGPWAVTSEFRHEQLVSKMGIELLRCEPGLVIGTMPVDGNRQPVGIMHGGANAVLAETLGSVAAFLHTGPGGTAVGLDLSCTHHRWVAGGTVTGVCRPLHEGRTTATYEIVISDGSGRRSCTARLTCAVSPPARYRGARREPTRAGPGPRFTNDREANTPCATAPTAGPPPSPTPAAWPRRG